MIKLYLVIEKKWRKNLNEVIASTDLKFSLSDIPTNRIEQRRISERNA